MHRPENAVGPCPKVGYVSPIGLNPYPNHFTDALGPPSAPDTRRGARGLTSLMRVCCFLSYAVGASVTYAYVIDVMFMKSSRLGTMLRAREATRPEVQMMCEGRPNEDGMQRRGNMQDDATKMDDDELMLDGVGTRSMKRLTRTMTMTTR